MSRETKDTEKDILCVDNAANMVTRIQLKLLAMLKKCPFKTRTEYHIINNVIEAKIEILSDKRRNSTTNCVGKKSREKRRIRRQMERDKMKQNQHKQPVQKHSVSGDTAQKQQPVQKQSVSSDTAQKQNLQSVQNVDVFLSNLAKVKRSSSSLVSCRKFQTGQDGPEPATHTGKPAAAGVSSTEPQGRHQVGDKTTHLVNLIDHKITQLNEKVTIIQKEKFVLHDEMAKV